MIWNELIELPPDFYLCFFRQEIGPDGKHLLCHQKNTLRVLPIMLFSSAMSFWKMLISLAIK